MPDAVPFDPELDDGPTSEVPTPRVLPPEMFHPSWPECGIPSMPPARGYESSASAELRLRYEDVTQDGRVQLPSLMTGLGAVWNELGRMHALEHFRTRGILPIVRRLVMTGEQGPFSIYAPVHVSGTWRLAREKDGDRIFLDMWLDAHAPRASTFGPAPAPDADRVLVGRIYGEHVVTKPFAPPAERKVTRLDVPGLPDVPEDVHSFEESEALVEGHPLEAAREVSFGTMHTDSNQHVNSLVYPRLFEETVIEHAMRQELTASPEKLLVRAVELRYRKPFFAGDRATIALHAKPMATGGLHAVGTFALAGKPGTPSCAIAMRLG